VNTRLTFNLGLRFDRYRAFLPEQEGPPVGPFNATQVSFPEVSDAKTFNLPVPRLGLVFDLTGQGRTVLKANYAQYAWNPGAQGLASDLNPNTTDWYGRYRWADTNGNLLYDRGEEGVVITRLGGVASAVLDPNLKNTKTNEISAWVEHELIPGLAIQGGYVYRKIDDFRVRVNQNRPMDAYNIPITIRDPGPDGVLNNADDGPGIPGFNLSAAALAAPVVNVTTNLPGSAEYQTIEFSANKRQSGRWSLQGSVSIRWNEDQETGYFGNNLRALTTPSTPNDLINTNDGRYNFSMWTMKINGSYDAGWGIRLTPALRFQQGSPSAGRSWPAPTTASTTDRSASSPSRSTRSGRTTSPSSTSGRRSSSPSAEAGSACSPISTTSPTPTPRRTSRGTAVRRTSCRSASSVRRSCGSA
jgi:hypothetical protein